MTSKLERAIAIHERWLAEQQRQPVAALLAEHPDLAEILAALVVDAGEVERAITLLDGEHCELGDLRLVAEIGRGGMGVVYRARQLSLDRDVAVKVLAGHVTRQPEAVARFKREATLAASLEHPNIVVIHGVGQVGDTHYFAMELVEGGPLTRLDPATGEPRSVRSIVELCAKIAEALAHAHQNGVLHRDVKPGNILLRAGGEPVLTDFGLARQIEDPGVTRSGAFAGTPWYASPEQLFDSASVDARSDVWSLGATLYELLTGRRPFDGDSAAGVAERIRTSEPPDPLRLVPDLSSDLAAIVGKALEKAPERRYPSAVAFAADLRAFLEFRPVVARRLGWPQRSARWLRRHPGWRATLAMLAVALFVLPVVVSLAVAAQRDRAIEAEQQARRRAYGANVAAAVTALTVGHGVQAAQRLAACPEDLRDFEWRLVQQSLDRSLWATKVGERRVVAVALAAEARRVVVADDEGALVLLDTSSGAVCWRQPSSKERFGDVAAVGFAADGGGILVAHTTGCLRRLAVESGEPTNVVQGAGPTVVAIEARGDHVVRSLPSGRIERFDAALSSRQELSLPGAFERLHLGLVGDGTHFVGSAQLGGFVLWNASTEQIVRRASGSAPERPVADDALARIVGFDVLAGFTWWDRPSDSVHRMHHGARQVASFDVSPDGRWLCAGGRRGEVLVFDLDQARLVRTLLGNAASVEAIAVGAGGWLATGAADGTVRFWNTFADAGVGEVAGVGYHASLSGASFGRGLAVDRAGTLFTGGLDGTVRCLEPRSGALRWQRQFPHWINAVVSLPDGGDVLVTWHDRLQRLAAADGRPIGACLSTGMAYVRRMVVGPDEVHCALLDDAGQVALVDLRSGAVLGPLPVATLTDPRSGGLVFGPDGSLWVGDEQGFVRRLDGTTLAAVAAFRADAGVTALACDADDTLLVATWNAAARRGRLVRYSPAGEPLAAADLPSLPTAIATFDQRVAVSRFDGRLSLHDRADLSSVVELPQPATALWNVVAYAGGPWLAVQCHDGEPRVLAADEGELDVAVRRERAMRSAAVHLAAEALLPTGWSPAARQSLLVRPGLPDDMRAAAVEALPPPAWWRLRDIALHLGFAGHLDQDTRRRLVEVQACLSESLPIVEGSDRPAHQVVLALVAMRLGEHEAALQRLEGAEFAALDPWTSVVRQFSRCLAHAARGEREPARAALAAMQAAYAACESPPPQHLLREAEDRVASLR
ncbi:MAG: protein kinase [Planctomycetes bacterium]|nr:protein kinase [Planctomycetota bacterium]